MGSPGRQRWFCFYDIYFLACTGLCSRHEYSYFWESVAKFIASFFIIQLCHHLEQDVWDVKIKTEFILVDSPYNVRRDFGRQIYKYDLSGKDNIFEIVEVCGDYLKLDDRAQMFCSAVQFLSWVKAVSASIENITFEGAEGKELECEETLFG